MKELTGYLIDRATGLGISGKTVSFLKLDATAVPVSGSGLTTGAKDSVTAADGKFSAWWELSPGPVNILVDAGASEKKVRKHNEKAQLGWQWSSDISRLARGFSPGVIRGFLNEFGTPTFSGHNIILPTGGSIFNGGMLSVESGPMTLTGAANPAGPANPRYDLITLRRYHENAAGQLAGSETIVITQGVTTSVAPATPTGADFLDLPLWVVSTATGAATKTVPADGDKRIFANPSSADMAMKSGYLVKVSDQLLTTSYVSAETVTVTGLDPNRIYDGEFIIHGNYANTPAIANPNFIFLNTSNTYLLGTGIFDQGVASVRSSALAYGSFSFSWPIVGLTGSSSFSVTPFLKRQNTNSDIVIHAGSTTYHIRVKPRI